MRPVSGLIPARFLLLLAHLTLVISIFWSRDANVRACLPSTFTQDEYNARDTELIVALSLTLVLLIVEFGGFISGASMFIHSQSLLSIAAHAGASVALAFFLFDAYSCVLYWWIFAFCSGLPAVIEVFVLISVLCLRRGI